MGHKRCHFYFRIFFRIILVTWNVWIGFTIISVSRPNALYGGSWNEKKSLQMQIYNLFTLWKFERSAAVHHNMLFSSKVQRKAKSLNTRNTLDFDQSNYSSRIVFSHIPIEFGQTGNSAIRSADDENPTIEQNTEKIAWSAAEISPFEFSKMAVAVGRQYILLLTLIS